MKHKAWHAKTTYHIKTPDGMMHREYELLELQGDMTIDFLETWFDAIVSRGEVHDKKERQ